MLFGCGRPERRIVQHDALQHAALRHRGRAAICDILHMHDGKRAPAKAVKCAKDDSDCVTFSKASDWAMLEADQANYERFEAWFEDNCLITVTTTCATPSTLSSRTRSTSRSAATEPSGPTCRPGGSTPPPSVFCQPRVLTGLESYFQKYFQTFCSFLQFCDGWSFPSHGCLSTLRQGRCGYDGREDTIV